MNISKDCLDPEFASAAVTHRTYNNMVAQHSNRAHVSLALHQQPDMHGNDLISVYEMDILPHVGGSKSH